MRVSLSGKAPARLLLVFGLAGTAAGCESLLDVDNPATFAAEDLNDPAVVPVLVSGVVGRFQNGFDDLALNSAIFTDEAVTGNNFETVQRLDLRTADPLNSGDVYLPLQYTRAAADSFEARLNRIFPDTAARSLGVARVQAYGALTYALMGEFLCQAPVDPAQPAIQPDSMFKIAIERANRAIATATAFKTAAGGTSARADSLINFARVTAARAALNLGDRTTAATYASAALQADTTFELRAFYDATNVNNVFFGSTTGANRNLGVDVRFRNLRSVDTFPELRVRHTASGGFGHDQRTTLFTPFQPASFGGFSRASRTGVIFARETSIRVSSDLEAKYILAEAQGRNASNINFLNGRSRFGTPDTAIALGRTPAQLAPDATDAQYLAFLIDQRRRDFFLDGHRLGDLRRYIRLYNLDFFPSGVHPTPGRGNYGTGTCFTPTTAEEVGNPNF